MNSTGLSRSSKRQQQNSKQFPIVGIGGSAGGIDAIKELLGNLRPDLGMAFIYIHHLDPSYNSLLPELLSKCTSMPVLEAKHLSSIKEDHFYIIPPDKDMDIIDGTFELIPRKSKPGLHLPINHFFLSLAERHNNSAIGIILSGTGSDGAIGIKAIKVAGGITFAQDESARFQSMPKAAIENGGIDLVLPPKEMAEELERLAKQASSLLLEKEQDVIDPDEEKELQQILLLLRTNKSVDFSHYKIGTIKRRILRRMFLYKLETFKDYSKYTYQFPEEINNLYQDLLINVTTFFREEETFEYLSSNILPSIVENKTEKDSIRIWVPACSTGQEPYSIAMLLMEIMEERKSKSPVQIFASDLSEAAINKARLGIYSQEEVSGISPERLQRFFVKQDNNYRISKQIRDICIFAPQNIFRDPPFSRLDIISCCNVFIYLDSLLQKKVIATFHYALNEKGYLMLGKSESIGSSPYFSQLDKKYKIFIRKKDVAGRAMFEMNSQLFRHEKTTVELVKTPAGVTPPVVNKLEKNVDDILLAHYTPACVVVNTDLEILQFKGSTGLFLEPSPGKASFNLLKMARPELGFEVRTCIQKVVKSGQPHKKTGIEINVNNHRHLVSIEAIPISKEHEETLFLIVFTEQPVRKLTGKKSTDKHERVIELEKELAGLKEDMQFIIQAQQEDHEALQSANEEIVSSNEELQSINEELETSKEEIESANEELITINQELLLRNEQLQEAKEYIEAIADTIRESMIILDDKFRIKSANKAFYKTFHVREDEVEDIVLYEVGNGQWNIPALRELLTGIIPGNTSFQGFEVTHVFPEIGEKTMLLNARKVIQKNPENKLILLAIEDVTEYRQMTKELSEKEAWFRNMANNAPVMIWVAGADRHYNFVNKTWQEYTGRTLQEETGRKWLNGIHPDDREHFVNVFNGSMQAREPFRIEYRLQRADGEYRWVQNNGVPFFSHDGSFEGYIGSCTEIHDHRQMHRDLEQQVNERTRELNDLNTELQQSNNELSQFAYIASHDLQEPLRKIITFSDKLNEKSNSKDIDPNYLHKIITSAQHMTQLINDLLNFSRMNRENQPYRMFPLKEAYDLAISDLELIIAEKKATIRQSDLPVIECIPVQMRQLFFNLLSNALKFSMENRDPEITITCRTLPESEKEQFPSLKKYVKYYEIVFQDNGIGFRQEFADKIFVIFQRLHELKRYSGTGIGLALCRKVVANHKGELFAIGKENEGAAFHLILPEKQR